MTLFVAEGMFLDRCVLSFVRTQPCFVCEQTNDESKIESVNLGEAQSHRILIGKEKSMAAHSFQAMLAYHRPRYDDVPRLGCAQCGELGHNLFISLCSHY